MWENKKKEEEKKTSPLFLEFNSAQQISLQIAIVHDDVRALEDESRAWSRDDPHQVLRERTGSAVR